ncbi:MAG TPA: CPBP family glutamic-type intramembrane protease [Ktedonobacteraceae bacterium]|nr:CPBP family glutamic-type intramembrane protease [Ktedonobacteraceae bacterium]
MSSSTLDTSTSTRSLSPRIAWRNALGLVVLLWLLFGLVNFGLVTNYLVTTIPNNLLLASFLLDLSFGITMVILVGLIVLWQRKHGETLWDIGWRRPTTTIAIIIGVIYGALWVILSYLRVPHPIQGFLALSWERPLMMLIGVFLAFGEELAMRGFFMEQLRRGGIPTWLQITSSAFFSGSYHGIIGLHYSLFYAFSSMILFGILAVIHVIGKRSLTPNTIAHAMAHFFGDPFLTMGILSGAIALASIH